MLTMTAGIQQIPPDHRGGHDLATDELRTEAEDYDQARAQINRTLPEGWRVIWLMVNR